MASLRHSPQLPQELVEQIIDSHSCDISTLRNCSLVSREWLPRSRYLLWRTTLFSDQDEDERVALFQDPAIASLVRQLTISSTSHTKWMEWLPKILTSVEKMTNIVRLRIRSSQNTYLGDGYFRAQARSLVHLTLDGVKFDSFATFTYVIAAFSKLESLSLLYVRWTERLGPARLEDRADGSALRLRTLRLGWLSAGKLGDLLSWLQCKRTTPPTIQCLAVGPFYFYEEVISEFLRQISPSIREVEIFQPVSALDNLLVPIIDATLAEPSFVKLETVNVTGIVPQRTRLATRPPPEAHLQARLPLLSKRREVQICVTWRYTDPTWPEW